VRKRVRKSQEVYRWEHYIILVTTSYMLNIIETFFLTLFQKHRHNNTSRRYGF